jgi:hypothetical protein
MDSFRVAIAQLVSEALPELTAEKVYEAVDYGKKGEDFTIALPRFRLKAKVDELAKKITDHVRVSHPQKREMTHVLSVPTKRMGRESLRRQGVHSLPMQHRQRHEARSQPGA